MNAFEDGNTFNQDFKVKLQLFEQTLKSGFTQYFDVDEIEDIIIHYIDENNVLFAKKALDFGLTHFPYSNALKLKQAHILSIEQKTHEALTILNSIKSLELQNPDFYILQGNIYSQTGLKEEAVLSYKNALNYTDMPDEIYSMIASEYIDLKKMPDAQYYLKKAIEINPNNESSLNELGLCYEITQQTDEAIDFFTQTTNAHPFNFIAWFYLGVNYNRALQFEKAINAYDYALALNDKFASAYFNKGNSLAQLNRYQEAIVMYRETFLYESPEASTYYHIGECFENLSKYDEALVNYHKTIKLDNEFADAWFSICIVLDIQNRIVESIHYAKKAIELNPFISDYWYVYAEIQAKLGFIEEAIEGFEKVLDLGYLDFDIYLDYSKALFESGQFEKSEECLTIALDKFKDASEVYYRMSGIKMKLGKRKEALTYLEQALTLDFTKQNDLFDYLPNLKNDEAVIQIIQAFKSK